MRLAMLWSGLTVVVVILLRLVLEPFNGDVAAAFLSAGVAIIGNLSSIETRRILGEEFEVDRLLVPAQTSYLVALFSLAPTIAHLMLPFQPDVAPWLRLLAYPVVFATVTFLLSNLSYLFCRISFSAAEMRDFYRRRYRRRRQRTVVQ